MTVGRLNLLAKAAEHPEVAARWVLPPSRLASSTIGGLCCRRADVSGISGTDSHYIHERREIVCMSWHISFLLLLLLLSLSLSSWLLSLSLLLFQLHLFSCMPRWLHGCGSPWKSYHYGSDMDRTLQLAPTVRYFSVEICKSADLPPFWAQKLVYSRILSSMTNQTAAAGMGEAPLHTHRFKLFHASFWVFGIQNAF